MPPGLESCTDPAHRHHDQSDHGYTDKLGPSVIEVTVYVAGFSVHTHPAIERQTVVDSLRMIADGLESGEVNPIGDDG